MRMYIQFGWYERSKLIEVVLVRDGIARIHCYADWRHALAELSEVISFSDCPIIVNLLASGE
jgi:hypothetical protein